MICLYRLNRVFRQITVCLNILGEGVRQTASQKPYQQIQTVGSSIQAIKTL